MLTGYQLPNEFYRKLGSDEKRFRLHLKSDRYYLTAHPTEEFTGKAAFAGVEIAGPEICSKGFTLVIKIGESERFFQWQKNMRSWAFSFSLNDNEIVIFRL